MNPVQALSKRGKAVWKRLSQRSSSNFKFAFLFLRPHQREALEQVYDFCRIVDDIVDERPPGPAGDEQAEAGLALWREEVERIYSGTDTPTTELGRALVSSARSFNLPREAFDEIIEGCAMDLQQDRYATKEQLELYCYRVASCVGLLCVGIFGDQGEAANRYAHHLGLALQYTNILRDVAEDALRGRVYLPLDLLEEHGLGEAEIVGNRYDARFIAAADAFADRAQAEYELAWAAFDEVEHPRALLPAEIMGRTYHAILREIRERRYDVFVQRASLRRRDKLKVAAVALARTNLQAASSVARLTS